MADYLVQEVDGTSRFILEDASGDLLLEQQGISPSFIASVTTVYAPSVPEVNAPFIASVTVLYAPTPAYVGGVSLSVAGTYSWLCPADVTSVTAEVIAGGGSGFGDTTGNAGFSAGGGGAYAKRTSIAVTPGTLYMFVVGAGGPAGNNTSTDGTDSSFTGDAGVQAVAKGGKKGVGSTGGGGAGGLASASTGDTKFSGGTGGGGLALSARGGGGGGASGNRLADGAPGSDSINSTSGQPGGTGANGGGSGGNGGNNGSTGSDGSSPGGGGGGAGANGFGSAGADGRVIITPGIVLNFIASTTTVYAPSVPEVFVPFIASATSVHAPTLVVPITLALAGTSSLSATVTTHIRFTLSLAGTSSLAVTVTSTGAVTVPVVVTLAGTSSLSARFTHRQFTCTLAGVGHLRIFSVFDSDATGVGPGNGGEVFGLRLAPNGITETATLDGAIGTTDSTLSLSGDSAFPSSDPFVVTIDSEVLYVIPRGGSNYSIRGRGLSNTISASHSDSVSVAWNDTYDMAIAADNDIAHEFTADINSTGVFTYPGWLICFDSSQAYLDSDRYPFHVTSVLGVFDAGAGSGGTNRCDAAQPNAVCTPVGVADDCPAALSNPSRIADDILNGDVALVQYTNPEAVVLDLGSRSAALQSWFGLMRVDATDTDVTFTDPTGYVVDTIPSGGGPGPFTGSINGVWGNPIPLLTGIDPIASREDPAHAPIYTSSPVPWTTVTLPGAERYFTYGPPHYGQKGWPMCCLAVRQNNRRIPYWASWDWRDYNFVYTGFGPDYTYAQLLINRNGITFNSVPEVELPGPQDIDGPDVEWDDPTYFVAASWYVVLFNGPYIVFGPGIGGGFTPDSGSGPGGGGFVPGVTFPGGPGEPPVISVPPIEGGSGGGISPPVGAGLRAHIRWPVSVKNDPTESGPQPAPAPVPPPPTPEGYFVSLEGGSSLDVLTYVSGPGTATITTTLHGSGGFLPPGQVRPITLSLHGA